MYQARSFILLALHSYTKTHQNQLTRRPYNDLHKF